MRIVTENTDLSLRYADHFREVEGHLREQSPDSLNMPREKAFQDFIRQGIPAKKNENYKYTHLQPSFSPDYTIQNTRIDTDFKLQDIFRCDIPRLDTSLILLLNGWFHSMSSSKGSLPGGILAGSLEKMAFQYPEIFKDHYAKLADTDADPLVALNTAFATDGYFLYIPKNIKVEKPVQIINILQSENDQFVTQRNLVIIEPGAEVKLIVCDHTLSLNRFLFNVVTEVYVGENASADFCTVQNQHNQTTSVHSAFFHQKNDSRLTAHFITLHGGLVRNNLKVMLDGMDSEANLYGMAFMDRKQHVDNFTQVVHAQPKCRSNQHYKNVLDDESTGAFSGRIHVMRDAQKTNAYQRNNNLLLTDKAMMQTKPQLIIEADDVKCSHGATVGQINEDALFYLRSRGIEENQARLMLMNAFSYEVVQEISIGPLRERISELIDKRLRGDVGRCHECAYHCDC
jgi:Fe-S cluster assembly protein SufD